MVTPSDPPYVLIGALLESPEPITADDVEAALGAAAEFSAEEVRLLGDVARVHGSRFEPNALALLKKAVNPSSTYSPLALDTPTAGGVSLRAVADRVSSELKPDATGRLSRDSVAATYSGLEDRYGSDVARGILSSVLGRRVEELSIDAAGWLQELHGSMDGNLDRIQAVLVRHLQAGHFVDADLDGTIDADDLVFIEGADGTIDVQKVGDTLRDRLRIESAMVNAAEAMGAADPGFVLMEAGFDVNTDYWELVPLQTGYNYSAFRIKEGVRPSVALADVFLQPHLYGFECATAKALVFHKALLDLLGPNDFDRIFPNLQLGPRELITSLGPFVENLGRGMLPDPEHREQLPAGTGVYFKNWGVTQKGRDEGWGGENAIYLGGNRFYGHPFGVSTEQHILSSLDSEDKLAPSAGRRREAAMVPKHTQLRSDVLRHDLDPEDSKRRSVGRSPWLDRLRAAVRYSSGPG